MAKSATTKTKKRVPKNVKKTPVDTVVEEPTPVDPEIERKERLSKVKDLPKKLKKMATRTVQFDGDKAEAWLEKNTNNRPLTKSFVKSLAHKMAVVPREFRTTSQGISIATNGDLQDGQHRLAAVVEYYKTYEDPKPVEIRVTEGEEPHFEFFDQGKNRTTADVFAIDGVEYAKEASYAARLLWIRYYRKRVAGAGKVSPYELKEFIHESPFNKLHTSVKFIMSFGQDEDSLPCRELMSAGYAAALHFLMANADDVEDGRKKADEFWTMVIEREAPKNSAPYKLYRRLMKVNSDKTLKLSRDGLVDLCIQAFNNWVDGVNALSLTKDSKPELGGYDGGGVELEQE